MRPVAALGSVVVVLASITPALAETLYCSTSFQGYRVCDNGHGYRSTEWSRDGMTIGDDNQGNRWTT